MFYNKKIHLLFSLQEKEKSLKFLLRILIRETETSFELRRPSTFEWPNQIFFTYRPKSLDTLSRVLGGTLDYTNLRGTWFGAWCWEVQQTTLT